MNGEVGAEVTAELQGLQATVGVEQQGTCNAGVTRHSHDSLVGTV